MIRLKQILYPLAFILIATSCGKVNSSAATTSLPSQISTSAQ